MKRLNSALCLTLLASAALAHSGATGVVKERMDMMKDLGATLKSLSVMSRSEIYNQEFVETSARDMKLHAAHMADMFPVGSDAKPSEVRPEIWTDRAKFDALFVELSVAAEALAASAGDKAALPARVVEISAVCRDCHDGFRVKK